MHDNIDRWTEISALAQAASFLQLSDTCQNQFRLLWMLSKLCPQASCYHLNHAIWHLRDTKGTDRVNSFFKKKKHLTWIHAEKHYITLKAYYIKHTHTHTPKHKCNVGYQVLMYIALGEAHELDESSSGLFAHVCVLNSCRV